MDNDVEMEDNSNHHSYGGGGSGMTTNAATAAVTEAAAVVDMGYEDHAPMPRRGSMTHAEEKQRRASIKAIMSDTTLTPMARRRSIQHLMDGRRNSMSGGNSVHSGQSSCANSSCGETPETFNSSSEQSNGYGYGHGHGHGYSMNNSGAGAGAENPYGYGAGAPNGESDPYGYEEAPPMIASVYGYGDGEPGNSAAGGRYGGRRGSASGAVTYTTGAYAFSNEQTRRSEQQRPHCSHYERNCSIVAPCCGATFGCRICHDDCPVLPPKINNGGKRYHRSASLPSSFTSMGSTAASNDDDDTHHNIDRFAIREVICRECFTRQSSKTNNCVNCGVQFGSYHCNICNLWMSDEEAPYHCEDCGFCRVGGAHNFQHCHDCGMCIDKTLYNNHNCKAGKYRSNCPVCQEFLFSSRSASHEMPCGHAIHWDCFRQLAAHDSRCPVCKKTAETRERMLPTWQAMAAGVALQPVPPDLCRVVNITCNDCEKAEENRAWHFLGVQCNHCQSFNTVVDSLVLSGEEAYQFLTEKSQYEPPPETRAGGRRRMNRRRSAF